MRGTPRSHRKTIGHRNNSRHGKSGNCLCSILTALLVAGALYMVMMIFANSGDVHDATKHLKTLEGISNKANATQVHSGVNAMWQAHGAANAMSKSSSEEEEEESDPDGDASSDEKQDNEEESASDPKASSDDPEDNSAGGQDGDKSPDEKSGDQDDSSSDEGNEEPDTVVEANSGGHQDQDSVADK